MTHMNKNMDIRLNSKDAFGTIIAWGFARALVPMTLIGIGLGTAFIIGIAYNQPGLREHRAKQVSLMANYRKMDADCRRRHLEERGVLTSKAASFCHQYANSVYPVYE